MPIGLCARCKLPIPDSFHDFKEECECIDHKALAKKRGWAVRIKGKRYNYIKDNMVKEDA